jgi:hypothetical protein
MDKDVIVVSSPLSERYAKNGSRAIIDTKTNKIRVGGAWFDFDEARWKVAETDKVIFFKRGYRDAVELEDSLQTVGIDVVSMQIADDSDVTFQSDIPYNLNSIKTKEELIDTMNGAGWELCD